MIATFVIVAVLLAVVAGLVVAFLRTVASLRPDPVIEARVLDNHYRMSGKTPPPGHRSALEIEIYGEDDASERAERDLRE